MQYKVILYNTRADEWVDTSGNFEFYTREEAVLCCSRWSDLGADFIAIVWDGAIWTYYV
jgi:hypothetical protein